MKLLSIDCSTIHGSIALFQDGQLVKSRTWTETRARHEGLFDQINQLMPDQMWLSDVEEFAVGRGPGAYSGLRVSLLGAQALAAPGNARIRAVSSMEALARFTSQALDIKDITVVGDARRDSVWYGRIHPDLPNPYQVEWRVAKRCDILSHLTPESTLITPHWAELAFLREMTPGHTWIQNSQYPTAEHVGRLAMQCKSHHLPEEPAVPLYLHPAV